MKRRIDSVNWYTTLVTLALSIIGALNIDVTIDGTEAVNQVLAKNWEYIVSILVPSVITMSTKLWDKIKNKTLVFKDIFKSPNFITQALSTIALLATLINITFDSAMPQALSDAIFSGSIITILTALVAHVLNPIWHFIKDKFNKQ